ncbi:uncharacterized protein LTR77_008475 [Saxophila tyrrhenica]|uniref:Uncharacterized protein n=1 Tax=Saxophila tyrrhenica TaxID=1690608 RepID=A0AAV9P2Z6_9PEZI|nr:hypothetical protein LTR77_008475 [Saxophila tyrrhenica]
MTLLFGRFQGTVGMASLLVEKGDRVMCLADEQDVVADATPYPHKGESRSMPRNASKPDFLSAAAPSPTTNPPAGGFDDHVIMFIGSLRA